MRARTCPNDRCGFPIPPGESACLLCGTPLPDDATPEGRAIHELSREQERYDAMMRRNRGIREH
jgi:predicted nucleic acid-binding Zn ribbon protein